MWREKRQSLAQRGSGDDVVSDMGLSCATSDHCPPDTWGLTCYTVTERRDPGDAGGEESQEMQERGGLLIRGRGPGRDDPTLCSMQPG